MPDAPSPNDFTPAITPDSAPPTKRKPWLAIAGCIGCGCIGIPILIVGLGIVGLGGTFWSMVRSTGSYQVYQLAAAEVETNAIVTEALGSPVEPGWVLQTREHHDNETGHVCLRFPVTGADLSGSIYAEAQSSESTWQLHQLLLSVNGEAEIVELIPLTQDEESLCPDFDDPDSEPVESEPDATEARKRRGVMG
ncbi:MAG: cytochrome c oxidase assembly factor Coa1 family protein [Leptolyngbyaceae cyanobacterium]